MDSPLFNINYTDPVGTMITFLLLATIFGVTGYLLYFTLAKTILRKNNLHRDITLKITLLWALVAVLVLLNIFLGLLFFFTGWENLSFNSLNLYLGLLPFLVIYFGTAFSFWLIYNKFNTKQS